MCAGATLKLSDIDDILDFLCASANLRPIFFLWRPALPDQKDNMVLELAVESRADFIVTFNAKDFAGAVQFGIGVTDPGSFLATIGEKP